MKRILNFAKKVLPTLGGLSLVVVIWLCGYFFMEVTTASFITLWFVLEMNRKYHG